MLILDANLAPEGVTIPSRDYRGDHQEARGELGDAGAVPGDRERSKVTFGPVSSQVGEVH
jgi:hypothetical protein